MERKHVLTQPSVLCEQSSTPTPTLGLEWEGESTGRLWREKKKEEEVKEIVLDKHILMF